MLIRIITIEHCSLPWSISNTCKAGLKLQMRAKYASYDCVSEKRAALIRIQANLQGRSKISYWTSYLLKVEDPWAACVVCLQKAIHVLVQDSAQSKLDPTTILWGDHLGRVTASNTTFKSSERACKSCWSCWFFTCNSLFAFINSCICCVVACCWLCIFAISLRKDVAPLGFIGFEHSACNSIIHTKQSAQYSENLRTNIHGVYSWMSTFEERGPRYSWICYAQATHPCLLTVQHALLLFLWRKELKQKIRLH